MLENASPQWVVVDLGGTVGTLGNGRRRRTGCLWIRRSVVRVHPAVPAISAFTEPLALPGTRDSDGWGTRGGHKMPPLFGLSEGACVES